MSIWISLIIGAQLIAAGVSLVEKFIVTSGKIGRPVVMAFYTGLLSSLTILVFAFGWTDLSFGNFQIPSFSNVSFPTLTIAALSLFSGIAFMGGLISIFSAYKIADASDVIPIVNSAGAVAVLILSFYLLETSLTQNFLWGFLFLVVGTFLVARFRFTKKLLKDTLLAGLLFGTSSVLIKLLFLETNFDDAFFWSRVGVVISALFLLFLPNCCHRTVAGEVKNKGKGIFFALIGLKVFSGLAGFMALKALQLGDAAIVQSLTGFQFVFLLLFSIFIGHKTSVYCGENCTSKDKIQKVVSVAIIITGFALLFI